MRHHTGCISVPRPTEAQYIYSRARHFFQMSGFVLLRRVAVPKADIEHQTECPYQIPPRV